MTIMTEDQKKHMERAIELSKLSVASGGGPFGCVIVKDGEIVAEGVNRVTVWNDPTAHGEIVAIREACTKLSSFQLMDCDLYTSCEPCPMCLGAIYWSRPRAVYFANTRQDAAAIGFDDQFIYDELELDMGKRNIPFTQILRDQALVAFGEWSNKTNKTKY